MTMRDGMDTWLKHECVEAGHKLADLHLLLLLITDQLVHHSFDTAQFMLSKAEQELKRANNEGLLTDDVYHMALDNVRDLVKRHGTELEAIPPFEKYNQFLDMLETKMFEKVVECQCGKRKNVV